MIDFNEIQRNDPETAIAYLRELGAASGVVAAETVGMLANMQDDVPGAYQRFALELERADIAIEGVTL